MGRTGGDDDGDLNDEQGTVRIDSSVPDSTNLSGNHFINMPDLVEDSSWWKTTDGTEADRGGTTPGTTLAAPGVGSEWAWRSIGDDYVGYASSSNIPAGVSSPGNDATRGEEVVEIESFPSKFSRINLNPAYKYQPLPEAEADSTSNYIIIIQIADKKNSGDTSYKDVSLELFGEYVDPTTRAAKSILIDPIDESNSTFRRNQSLDTTVTGATNIGRVTKVRIKNTSGNALEVDYIKVRNEKADEDSGENEYGNFINIGKISGGDSGLQSEITQSRFNSFTIENDPTAEQLTDSFGTQVQAYIDAIAERRETFVKADKDYVLAQNIHATASDALTKANNVADRQKDISDLKMLIDGANNPDSEKEEVLQILNDIAEKVGLEILEKIVDIESKKDSYISSAESMIKKLENDEQRFKDYFLETLRAEIDRLETVLKNPEATDNVPEIESNLEIAKIELESKKNELNDDIEKFVADRRKEKEDSETDLDKKRETRDKNAEEIQEPATKFLNELKPFLGRGLQLQREMLIDRSFGFYNKTISSTEFELEVNNIKIGQFGSNAIVLPTFGIMARDSLETVSKYFGLFLVQRSVPPKYSICTVVRTREDRPPHITASWDFGEVNEDNVFNLKITRNGDTFSGFFGDKLVDSVQFSLTEDTAKVKWDPTGISSGFKTIKKKIHVGVSCFQGVGLQVNDVLLPDPFPSRIILPESPKLDYKQEINSNQKSFALIETYNMSLFHGKYGAGRTLNTFSLLPGEESTISMRTYKDSTSSVSNTSTVFDEVTDESTAEFEKEIEREKGEDRQYEQNMNIYIDSTVNAGASGVTAAGTSWHASTSVSSGFQRDTSSARQEMSRILSRALNKHATKASSKRTVEVVTTETLETEEGSSSTITRNLRNINNSKALTFVFRQLNQEYISVLHLVDIKVAYIGGGSGTYAQTSLERLEEFIGLYIKESEVKQIADAIIERARYVSVQDEDQPVDVLKKVSFAKPTSPSNERTSISFYSFNAKNRSKVVDYPNLKVPGYVIATDINVLRTDGVSTETILSPGVALDQYGIALQKTDIEMKKAETNLKNAQADLLRMQERFMNETRNENVRLKYLEHMNLLEPKYFAHQHKK